MPNSFVPCQQELDYIANKQMAEPAATNSIWTQITIFIVVFLFILVFIFVLIVVISKKKKG